MTEKNTIFDKYNILLYIIDLARTTNLKSLICYFIVVIIMFSRQIQSIRYGVYSGIIQFLVVVPATVFLLAINTFFELRQAMTSWSFDVFES